MLDAIAGNAHHHGFLQQPAKMYVARGTILSGTPPGYSQPPREPARHPVVFVQLSQPLHNFSFRLAFLGDRRETLTRRPEFLGRQPDQADADMWGLGQALAHWQQRAGRAGTCAARGRPMNGPLEMPFKAPPAAAKPYDWGGLYIGGHFGAAWGRSDWSAAGGLPLSGSFGLSGVSTPSRAPAATSAGCRPATTSCCRTTSCWE